MRVPGNYETLNQHWLNVSCLLVVRMCVCLYIFSTMGAIDQTLVKCWENVGDIGPTLAFLGGYALGTLCLGHHQSLDDDHPAHLAARISLCDECQGRIWLSTYVSSLTFRSQGDPGPSCNKHYFTPITEL